VTKPAPRRLPDMSEEARIAKQKAELLEEFNKRYMVVNDAGRVVVFQPVHDDVLNRTLYMRLSFDDFNRLYSNRHVPVLINQKGETVYDTAGKVWLGHEERKQYIHGVVFDPTGRQRDGVFNLWKGFAVTPRPGSWDKLREHIWDVICQGDDSNFRYLMCWMARMAQYPAQQGEVAVMLRSDKHGTGKGTLANALRYIMGQHGMCVRNSKHLVGNFNLHLRDCLFLFADEALFAGDKAHVGVLQSLITEDTLTIEGKYMNLVEEPNYLHLMLSSNAEWVIPAALSDRRFFVLEVSDKHVRDYPYFKALYHELEHGGYEAMLHELLTMDLSDFNVRDVPQTEGLDQQKQLSLDDDHRWWQDVLFRGYVYQSELGLEEEFGEWIETIATELLFKGYEQYAKRHRFRHPLTLPLFGRFLHKMLKPLLRPGQTIEALKSRPGSVLVGEHMTENGARTVHARKPCYNLGTLMECRFAFFEVTGLQIDWDHEIANEPPVRAAEGARVGERKRLFH
jgi:hypothetical protein